MGAYFLDLSYSVLVDFFLFFLRSCLFIQLFFLLVWFVYEHFTCILGTQVLPLHMYPCTHYKLSN